jgi:hypothetical protein
VNPAAQASVLVRADIPLSSVLFPVCGTLTDVQPAAAAAGAALTGLGNAHESAGFMIRQ